MSDPESTVPAGAIYEGTIRHRRFVPKEHRFRYRLYLVYVDLDRLEPLLESLPFASARDRRWPPALVRFRRRDYFGDPSIPLAEAVRREVAAKSGVRPRGPIRMLTHLRQWGVSFNPVTFYYCFPENSASPRPEPVIRPEHILVEVTNTPWGERHLYVLSEPDAVGGGSGSAEMLTYQRDKEFHVSPFLPMDQRYRWRFSVPGERLFVHIDNFGGSGFPAGSPEKRFDATLDLERRAPITARSLFGAQLRHPAMTAAVVYRIYRQAAALWSKRVPFHPHPSSTGG